MPRSNWVPLLHHAWNVLGSKLGPETGFPHLGFRGVLQYLQANVIWYFKVAMTTSSHPLYFFIN